MVPRSRTKSPPLNDMDSLTKSISQSFPWEEESYCLLERCRLNFQNTKHAPRQYIKHGAGSIIANLVIATASIDSPREQRMSCWQPILFSPFIHLFADIFPEIGGQTAAVVLHLEVRKVNGFFRSGGKGLLVNELVFAHL